MATLPCRVAYGISIEPGVEVRGAILESRLGAPFRFQIDQREAGNGLIAEFDRGTQAHGPGHGVEAVESLAGTTAEPASAGALKERLMELVGQSPLGIDGTAKVAERRQPRPGHGNRGHRRDDRNSEHEERDRGRQRGHGWVAPAPSP